ncbi:hypothetical protein Aperf_G00000033472 [Anoplocephala perfoliata]
MSIFVDGFANKIYDSEFKETHIPNFVTGDFDSIRPEVKEFYSCKDSVQVIETPDQDATDFTKAIMIMLENVQQNAADSSKPKINYIVGFYGSGGRADHEFGIVKSLYIAKEMSHIPVLLVTESSISCLLDCGHNQIELMNYPTEQYCGLIPIGRPVTATTTGLRWNLDDSLLDFEGLVSTSNRTIDTTVQVICNGPLLWTISNPLLETLKSVSSQK